MKFLWSNKACIYGASELHGSWSCFSSHTKGFLTSVNEWVPGGVVPLETTVMENIMRWWTTLIAHFKTLWNIKASVLEDSSLWKLIVPTAIRFSYKQHTSQSSSWSALLWFVHHPLCWFRSCSQQLNAGYSWAALAVSVCKLVHENLPHSQWNGKHLNFLSSYVPAAETIRCDSFPPPCPGFLWLQ